MAGVWAPVGGWRSGVEGPIRGVRLVDLCNARQAETSQKENVGGKMAKKRGWSKDMNYMHYKKMYIKNGYYILY